MPRMIAVDRFSFEFRNLFAKMVKGSLYASWLWRNLLLMTPLLNWIIGSWKSRKWIGATEYVDYKFEECNVYIKFT